MVEYGEEDDDIIVIHDSLGFGKCHLALGIPTDGIFAHVDSLKDLLAMPEVRGLPARGKRPWLCDAWVAFRDNRPSRPLSQWKERPLRVVTGYRYVAQSFFAKHNFTNYGECSAAARTDDQTSHLSLSARCYHPTSSSLALCPLSPELCSADGALEAAPKMGYADIILDLVSTGTTLRENNLKEIEGARMLESQGVLVGSRKALEANPVLLAVVRELIERLEAHLEANKFWTGKRWWDEGDRVWMNERVGSGVGCAQLIGARVARGRETTKRFP